MLLDDDPAKLGRERLGVPVVGPIGICTGRSLDAPKPPTWWLAPREAARRCATAVVASGVPFATLVSPDVDITGVTLAPDVIVYRNVTLGPESTLEDGRVRLHGRRRGTRVPCGRLRVIAPNAVLNARVVLGEGAYVGSNARSCRRCSIGAWAIVGAELRRDA